MALTKFKQSIKAATYLLLDFPEDNDQGACSMQVYAFFDQIYNTATHNYESGNSLKANLLRLRHKTFAYALADAIANNLLKISKGLERITHILAQHPKAFNLHELCRVRSGLEFLLTDFSIIPVYTGNPDKAPCTRREKDYYALHEYLYNDDKFTNFHIEHFDVYLRKACHENKLPIVDLHHAMPPAHWWWSEATKCECINTIFPTILIATDFEFLETTL